MVNVFWAVQEDHGTRQALPDFSGCVGSVVAHECAACAEKTASLPGPKSSLPLFCGFWCMERGVYVWPMVAYPVKRFVVYPHGMKNMGARTRLTTNLKTVGSRNGGWWRPWKRWVEDLRRSQVLAERTVATRFEPSGAGLVS